MLPATHKKIRVLLVDDHTIFRQALVRLLSLQPGVDVPLHCGSVGQALLVLAASTPDVVLLDIDLGAESGIEFLAQARRNGFRGPIVVLTAGVSEGDKQLLQNHGISGILRKDVSIDVLTSCIRRAAGIQLHEDSADTGLATSDRFELSKHQKALTARELEVLRLILEGHANKQIAHELACSESAVKGIIQQLFRKTGTGTRSQLVRVALEQYNGQI